MTVTALLLAGGTSSRMGGRNKLLEQIGGDPLLRHRARCCLASNVDAVRVVLPPNALALRDALVGLDVEIIENESAARGMSHSLNCGLKGLATDAALIVLADLPDLTSNHLNMVLSAAQAHPLVQVIRGATLGGKAGHPVLIRSALFDALHTLTGDTGAQPILRKHSADTVLVPIGPAALSDLDTPEDWAEWRAAQS